jgi:predicted ArsR family transcriptional regulator
MKTITPTGQDKVLAVLKTGVALTAKQIEARFGVGNARSTVSALRMKGFAIYCNESVDTKGRVKNKYRLGTPSRKVVAAGYRALAKASV